MGSLPMGQRGSERPVLTAARSHVRALEKAARDGQAGSLVLRIEAICYISQHQREVGLIGHGSFIWSPHAIIRSDYDGKQRGQTEVEGKETKGWPSPWPAATAMRAAIAMDVFMAILLTRTMAPNLLRYGESEGRPKRMVRWRSAGDMAELYY